MVTTRQPCRRRTIPTDSNGSVAILVDPTAAVRLVNIGTSISNYRSRWSTKTEYSRSSHRYRASHPLLNPFQRVIVNYAISLP